MAQHDDDGTGVTRREDDGGVPDAPLSPAGWLAQNATFLLMIGLAVGAVWHFHGPTGVLRPWRSAFAHARPRKRASVLSLERSRSVLVRCTIL